MASHLLKLSATLVLVLVSSAHGGLIDYATNTHAVAHTHENVVRTHDGTVSHFGKSVETPYSSVHKQDTRITSNNNHNTVYSVAAAPMEHTTYSHVTATPITESELSPGYQHHVPTVTTYTHQPVHQPIVHQVAHQPVHQPIVHQFAHQPTHQPIVHQVAHQAVHQPIHQVVHQPVHQSIQPVVHEPVHQPIHHQVAHQPVHHATHHVATHYSPAETVSHMSFEGFGTHYGY